MKYLVGLVLFVGSVVDAQEVQEVSEVRGSVRYSDQQVDYNSEYSSNLKMREERKMGVGTQIGSGLGMAGLNMEINIDPENSAMAGIGTGPGYGTFQLLWRHNWEGRYFTPYTTAGWSRWYNSDKSEDHEKSLILDRALNDEQKLTGRFGVDFLTGSLGMQYNQLSGDFAGTTFFVELALLAALRDFRPLPTGAVGAVYYF